MRTAPLGVVSEAVVVSVTKFVAAVMRWSSW